MARASSPPQQGLRPQPGQEKPLGAGSPPASRNPCKLRSLRTEHRANLPDTGNKLPSQFASLPPPLHQPAGLNENKITKEIGLDIFLVCYFSCKLCQLHKTPTVLPQDPCVDWLAEIRWTGRSLRADIVWKNAEGVQALPRCHGATYMYGNTHMHKGTAAPKNFPWLLIN